MVIFFLYFINYSVCFYYFENDMDNFFKLKYTFYCIIIILCLKYKKNSLILEDFLVAMILNNIYGYYKDEFNFTINDTIFIITYILIKYVHKHKRNITKYFDRINNFYTNFTQKK